MRFMSVKNPSSVSATSSTRPCSAPACPACVSSPLKYTRSWESGADQRSAFAQATAPALDAFLITVIIYLVLESSSMNRTLILLCLCLSLVVRGLAAGSPVYVLLWFDTEDYIDPVADDATLRIAQDLDRLGVRATFKVVGEKARTLEARGRRDVIRALANHDVGYHAETHSTPPAPSVYLADLDWLDGATEFERREGRGAADIRRIFGVTPSCYGQPRQFLWSAKLSGAATDGNPRLSRRRN
jgi:hypothetical protein